MNLARYRQNASAVLWVFCLLPGPSWAQTVVERGRAWVPAVQQEWEQYGRQYFQSVAADQPHATFQLRDSASRSGVGAFEIWLLVDGALVKGWTGAGDLRVSPGRHCIRIEMVALAQRYQGTVGQYWPWITAGSKDQVLFTGDSKAGFTTKYQRVAMRMNLETLLEPGRLEFDRDQPKNPGAVYAYCLEQVRKQRPQ